MDLNEYQRLAMRTDSKDNYDEDSQRIQRLTNGLMGLNGEAGEAIDILKKYMYQGHPFDYDKMIEELGDALWYIALTADAIGVPLDDVAWINIKKLKKRYPDGFTVEDSIMRADTVQEKSDRDQAIDNLMSALEDKLHEGNKHW